MTSSESEEDDLEFEAQSSEVEADEGAELEEELFDAVDAASNATSENEDGDDSEEDEEQSDEDDEDEDEQSQSGVLPPPVAPPRPPSRTVAPVPPPLTVSHDTTDTAGTARPPSPPPRQRSPSPAGLRRLAILSAIVHPRSYTVEAICAIPHPVPTHALASSLCLTHLLTGSDDGFVRDYDIFSAVNGKIFLTAQQRHHCGVIEGTMKAGQIRYWWENPGRTNFPPGMAQEDPSPAPVYSLAMHSDAVWALAGTDVGHINLFTGRHEPGKLCHVFAGHHGPVSSLSVQHDEKGFFSAGWDKTVLQWDLNTGQIVRGFVPHSAQLVAVAVRPLVPPSFAATPPPEETKATVHLGATSNRPPHSRTGADVSMADPPKRAKSEDAQSDFDPLFDGEPDADGEMDLELGGGSDMLAASLRAPTPNAFTLSMPSAAPPAWPSSAPTAAPSAHPPPPVVPPLALPAPPAPKNGPPLLDSLTAPEFSADILMTASFDGQVVLWDRRVSGGGGTGSAAKGVGRLWMHDKTPRWCVSACWSANGTQIYAGRRNGGIDVWDVRQLGRSGPTSAPRLMKTIRNPASSGIVSCVVAFPDGKHIACASNDNIRLWNVAEAGESTKSGVQFKIIPGHHGGIVSQMLVDPAARFLVSASSNRGWLGYGESSKTLFVHDVKHVN